MFLCIPVIKVFFSEKSLLKIKTAGFFFNKNSNLRMKGKACEEKKTQQPDGCEDFADEA